MNKYEEGLRLIDEKFGNGKDNIISLATIARETGTESNSRPVVCEVDAYYEKGAFYIITHAKSNKIQQIIQYNEVAIAVSNEWFTASGVGENLGWVLDPKNAELRLKLRKAFEPWYDMANNENDEDRCILAIYLSKGTLNINHGEELFHIDFAEIQAMRKNPMYMKDYISHLDAILSSTGERLLDGSGKVSHQEAMDKAQAEYKKYQAKTLTEVEKSYLDTIKMLENKTQKNKSENKQEQGKTN